MNIYGPKMAELRLLAPLILILNIRMLPLLDQHLPNIQVTWIPLEIRKTQTACQPAGHALNQ